MATPVGVVLPVDARIRAYPAVNAPLPFVVSDVPPKLLIVNGLNYGGGAVQSVFQGMTPVAMSQAALVCGLVEGFRLFGQTEAVG